MTIADYMARPEHAAVEVICRMMGMPDDLTELVTCVDCGTKVMAAGCAWRTNPRTFDWSGPHCGCTSIGENKEERE